GIAVAASELAADVRIDRPEIHSGGGWRVEHRSRRDGNELGAANALIQHLPGGPRRQQRKLLRAGAHPQPPQPQWRQLMQPEACASGPAQSGHTLSRGAERTSPGALAPGDVGLIRVRTTGPPPFGVSGQYTEENPKIKRHLSLIAGRWGPVD